MERRSTKPGFLNGFLQGVQTTQPANSESCQETEPFAASVINNFMVGLRPEPNLLVSEWAQRYRIVPGATSASPGIWRNDTAPYLSEIMDCLSPSHPCSTVTFQKSAQVGGTEIGTNWLGYIIDISPGPTLVVHPTIAAGKNWSREKLSPSISVSTRLQEKVEPQKSRDGGSTTDHKAFAGGFIVISGSNSSAGLRQKSIRFVLKDDWDEWTYDADGHGDPDKMVNARQMAFHVSGQSKTYQVSTPTIHSLSRIEAAFEQSDQRFFYVPCPYCNFQQKLFWKNLKFSKTLPHNAKYQCINCQELIHHYQKRMMLLNGKWIAAQSGSRQPGFAINALYSPFTTWDNMVQAFLEAKDDTMQLRTWVNLWLGEAWKSRGVGPRWQELASRPRTYDLGTVPSCEVILTCGVDLGKDYLHYEVVAWGTGKTSWSIDYGRILGDVTLPACWDQLTEKLETPYADVNGNLYGITMMAIDSGYHTTLVYDYVRNKRRTMPVKGAVGNTLFTVGRGTSIDKAATGKAKRLQVYMVGTWPLKTEFYANLNKTDPNQKGYCHFSKDHDEDFFKQITSETFSGGKKNGKPYGEWIVNGANHGLDARIYAMGALDHPTIQFSRLEFSRQALLASTQIPQKPRTSYKMKSRYLTP